MDENGHPIEAIEPPIVKLLLPSAALGPLESTSVTGNSPGTYVADLQFPSTGLWDVEIAVRVSRFEEAVARFTLEIE
jgi:copper transport protein